MKSGRTILQTAALILILGLVLTACSRSEATSLQQKGEETVTFQVTVNLPGQSNAFAVDSRGKLQSALALSSADGGIILSAEKNTIFQAQDGKPLQSIQGTVETSPPPSPEDAHVIGPIYSLKPDGAAFSPWLMLSLRYDPGRLPAGVQEKDLRVAYYSGSGWRIPSYSKGDTAAHTVTTQIYHFTSFTILAPKEPPVVTGSSVGNLAPDFKATDLDGKVVYLSALRGNPVIINFWSLDCPPCIEEMPHIQKLYEKWADKGLVVLAINLDSRISLAEIKEFMQSNGYSFPVLLDPGWEAGQKYRVRSYPTTFYIDKDGIIRLKRLGAFVSAQQMEDNLSRIMP